MVREALSTVYGLGDIMGIVSGWIWVHGIMIPIMGVLYEYMGKQMVAVEDTKHAIPS